MSSSNSSNTLSNAASIIKDFRESYRKLNKLKSMNYNKNSSGLNMAENRFYNECIDWMCFDIDKLKILGMPSSEPLDIACFPDYSIAYYNSNNNDKSEFIGKVVIAERQRIDLMNLILEE